MEVIKENEKACKYDNNDSVFLNDDHDHDHDYDRDRDEIMLIMAIIV